MTLKEQLNSQNLVSDFFSLSVYSLIQRTVVDSAQNLTLEKSQDERKAWCVTVTYPLGDCAPLNLDLTDSVVGKTTMFTGISGGLACQSNWSLHRCTKIFITLKKKKIAADPSGQYLMQA